MSNFIIFTKCMIYMFVDAELLLPIHGPAGFVKGGNIYLTKVTKSI